MRQCLLVSVFFFINVLPYSNAMPQTQGTTPHPVTVYRHMTMSLCHPLMWNATLEYTTTHFNVLGQAVTRPRNPPSTFHTHTSGRSTLSCLCMMLLWWYSVISSVESVSFPMSWTRGMWCANPLRYPDAFYINICTREWLSGQRVPSLTQYNTTYITPRFHLTGKYMRITS